METHSDLFFFEETRHPDQKGGIKINEKEKTVKNKRNLDG
jgi:hypothetical protein